MPSDNRYYTKSFITSKQNSMDNIGELKMLFSKGNGYEGRYNFPVTITKIVKNEDTNE
jgi:hypothetical protein